MTEVDSIIESEPNTELEVTKPFPKFVFPVHLWITFLHRKLTAADIAKKAPQQPPSPQAKEKESEKEESDTKKGSDKESQHHQQKSEPKKEQEKNNKENEKSPKDTKVSVLNGETWRDFSSIAAKVRIQIATTTKL